MKNFLAIYTGNTASPRRTEWDGLNEDERNKRVEAGMKAWMDWGTRNTAAIVENGGPLGKTKRTGPDGVSDIKNAMAGYTVVKAESHADAAKMFEGHPHFTIFPGESVEIMEVLPIPTK